MRQRPSVWYDPATRGTWTEIPGPVTPPDGPPALDTTGMVRVPGWARHPAVARRVARVVQRWVQWRERGRRA